MLKLISFPILLISFAIGIFFVYIMGVEPKIIHIYPSPDTINKYILQDKANNCFKYEKELVECPDDEDEIFQIPIQE
tara:strand:- start:531 stop:761 length:231 start_codon:yes stop_codon:yes gene_type:complete